MILAETIQFTPEQERALFLAFLVFLTVAALFVIGFVLSIVAGVRSGRHPDRRGWFVYWALWMVLEGLLAVSAVASTELIWIAIVGGMLTLTGGARVLAVTTRGITRGSTPPEESRPVHRDRGAPGSRP